MVVRSGDGAEQFSVTGHPVILDDSGARNYCACSRFGHFSFAFHIVLISPCLWESVRYRLNSLKDN